MSLKTFVRSSGLRGCIGILGCSVAAPVAAQSAEVIVQIQVQGNTLTPDAEMLEIAGVAVGMPFEAATIAATAARLERSGRFDRVQVLKRFASIADPTQIVLVVIVHEPGATIDLPGPGGRPARVVRRRGPGLQYLPLLDFDDGYGWTYGVQLARPNVLGARSRLSFPLTWGGERKAAAVLDKTFMAGPFTHVEGGGALTRREHPFYEQSETRRRVWVRGERAFGLTLRAGATADWQRVSLGGLVDDVPSIGADVTLDTRVDPWLARQAVYARAAWTRADLPAGAADVTAVDLRGYLGLPGQTVLVARAQREGAAEALPPYAQPMVGGADTLRGFPVGTAVGDAVAAGSLELRVPLNSPLQVAKLGVHAFVDAGAAYDAGERLRKQKFDRGVGGGVWFSLAVVRLELSVAHGLGATTRVHFGMNVGF